MCAATVADSALQLFKRQLQLLDLPVQLLGRLPELHPRQPRDLHAQRSDAKITALELGAGFGASTASKTCWTSTATPCPPICKGAALPVARCR